MLRLRTLWAVIRRSGLGPLTLAFFVLFALCAVIIWLCDPLTTSLGDALWFCYQAVSTIGFGDITAGRGLARVVTVILSVFSIFYIALVTGVVVNYVNEVIRQRQEGTLSRFMHTLEHLEELSPEELAAFSKSVRTYLDRH